MLCMIAHGQLVADMWWTTCIGPSGSPAVLHSSASATHAALSVIFESLLSLSCTLIAGLQVEGWNEAREGGNWFGAFLHHICSYQVMLKQERASVRLHWLVEQMSVVCTQHFLIRPGTFWLATGKY